MEPTNKPSTDFDVRKAAREFIEEHRGVLDIPFDPAVRAEAIAATGRLVADKRKGGERVGQLLFNAIRSRWPGNGDHAAQDAQIAHRLFTIHDEELAEVLEWYLARKASLGASGGITKPPAVK